jgi:deoxyribodipyrimidine photo-lyase
VDKKKDEIAIFWFRRDLSLLDNIGLFHALKSRFKVLLIFIFDADIMEELPKNDSRVSFIFDTLNQIHFELLKKNSSILIKKGTVIQVWKELLSEYNIKQVFFNKDYEPYAIKRDERVSKLLQSNGVEVSTYKNDVIFEENDVLKDDGLPYTVYTPYKNKWLRLLEPKHFQSVTIDKDLLGNFHQIKIPFPSLEHIGFINGDHKVNAYNLEAISDYQKYRDYPAMDKTSYLSPHLRFGTVSIRKLVSLAHNKNQTFLNELIWREFFKQILFHFPKVVTHNFKSAYDGIAWRENESDFELWCQGKTGYPLVDAGMRQLNRTGYMHNRVRMITAGFLCKHLLMNWKLGEAYFAEKLLDYELSSNNGNWQWAAGTGCDAAPYFRVFNPETQLKKFDKDLKYVKKWIPEFDNDYCPPIVEHKFARERAIETYKKGIVR